jgi:hypothetical protein
MSTIGPVPIHEALEGLSFPATREQILAHVDAASSDNAALVRSKLEAIPDGEYASVDDVDEALPDESY